MPFPFFFSFLERSCEAKLEILKVFITSSLSSIGCLNLLYITSPREFLLHFSLKSCLVSISSVDHEPIYNLENSIPISSNSKRSFQEGVALGRNFFRISFRKFLVSSSRLPFLVLPSRLSVKGLYSNPKYFNVSSHLLSRLTNLDFCS
jgi:hypothetical protein